MNFIEQSVQRRLIRGAGVFPIWGLDGDGEKEIVAAQEQRRPAPLVSDRFFEGINQPKDDNGGGSG